MDTDVLVVGAGPVGLLLAAELALAGVRTLVVERLARPSTERKARGIGTLAAEALRRRGLGAALAEHHERGAADFRAAHGSDRGHFAWLHKIDLVPADEPERTYSFIWQPELEELLGEYAAGLGVPVLRGQPLTDLTQDGAGVTATVGSGRITASYLVGCDGGRSTVRKLAGFAFPGTAPYLIMRAGTATLADPAVLPAPGRRDTGSLMHGGGLLGTLELGTVEFGTVEFGSFPEDRSTPLTAAELTDSVRRVAGVDVTITALDEPKRVADHARQATPYRLGRVLLAGDAAHVHSPNGGQGLNLGLMDATNLGWKLAASLRRPGPFADELLDSYSAERHPVAAAVLHNTRAQSALLAPGPHTDALRDIMSELMDLPQVNAYFAELMSGLHARYPLPYPTEDHPLLGAHCPDLALDGSTLYAHTAGGRAVLLAPADEPGVAGAAAPWADRSTIVAAAELDRDDLTGLLLRPDGIVAWTAAPDRPADTTALRTALHTWLGDPGERARGG